MADGRLSIVGLHGGIWFGVDAGQAIAEANAVIGTERHLAHLDTDLGGRGVAYRSLGELLDLVGAHLDHDAHVCVLASGDPGFFGAGRILSARFPAAATAVHPAPSSVALAFARAGLPWDDAVIVSVHGRHLDAGLPALRTAAKAAVLTSPACPPEAIGRALAGADRDVWVASRLGEADEAVARTDVAGLAAGTWDALSVVIVTSAAAKTAASATVTWTPTPTLAHRAGMITKPEVRAVVVSKLQLHPTATLWDIGAGSGSVAVEACRTVPGLRAWAVEQRTDDCARIVTNAAGLPVTVVEGRAPEALVGLPDADRVFVGGGGIGVLDAVRDRVATDGVVVATFAVIERASEAARRLGNLVQISVSRAVPIGPDQALRLEADNPVWVAWGPGART